MARIRLTKNALRAEELKLRQFERYLPTLQLKKSMLQAEVIAAGVEIEQMQTQKDKAIEQVDHFAELLAKETDMGLLAFLRVECVAKRYENVAGVEIPIFEQVVFAKADYSLFDTPVWFDSALKKLRHMVVIREKIHVAEEKKHALEKDLRDVSIRVNLFEKVLIPSSEQNIKKIKVFLGDQALAAVAQAKVAKQKILAKRVR